MIDGTEVENEDKPKSRFAITPNWTIVAVAVVQLATAVWWCGGVGQRLEDHDRRIGLLEAATVLSQKQISDLVGAVSGVAGKIDTAITTQAQLSNDISRRLETIDDRNSRQIEQLQQHLMDGPTHK